MLKEIIQKLKIIFIPGQDNKYRPKFLESRVIFYVLIALLILKLFTIPFFLSLPKNIFFAALVENTLVKLTNQERQSLGLQSLRENSKLKTAALLKAKDMLEKDYFSHHGPEGISPWHWFRVVGYDYKIAGENLAIGFLDSEQVHQAWLESASHRANLLNPAYQEIGIAVLKGDFQGNETTVVVQLFASPAISQTKPITEPTREPLPESQEMVEPSPEIAEILPPEIYPEPEQIISPYRELTEPRGELIFNSLSFLTSDFYQLLQKFIYGFLILIIISLLISIFVRFDIQHPDLIFKAIFSIGLLILFVLIDKVDMLNLISRNFAIY